MSGERTSLPASANGLLRGSRNRSYGSLVRSPLSPVHQRRIEHTLQPGETLQGLAVKYGVSMEQIKRANRLYTNDSIFLKSSLSIPVLSDWGDCSNGAAVAEGVSGKGDAVRENQDVGDKRVSDLTPGDFLKRLDDLISQSKQAVVKGSQEVEERVAALEAACTGPQSVVSPSRLQLQQQQSAAAAAAHGALPLTVIKFTKSLREREDEIFEL